MKLFPWILITGIIFASCSGPCPSLNDEKKAEIDTQVRAVWQQLGQTVKVADAEGFNSFVSTEGFLAMHTQGCNMSSRQAYADSVRSWFSGRKSAKLLNPELTIKPLSENLALLDQAAGFVTVSPDGIADTVQHTVSFVFQREASGWKIIHGHESWR